MVNVRQLRDFSKCRGEVAPRALVGAFPLIRSIAALTFNTRALFCAAPHHAKRRCAFALQLARSYDVCAFEETHGKPRLVRKHFACIRKTHFILASFCNSVDLDKNGREFVKKSSGGIVITIKRSLLMGSPHFAVSHQELVKGRVLRVIVETPFGRMVVVGVHNFGLTKAEMAIVEYALNCDIDSVYEDNLGNFVLLLGDFNFSK